MSNSSQTNPDRIRTYNLTALVHDPTSRLHALVEAAPKKPKDTRAICDYLFDLSTDFDDLMYVCDVLNGTHTRPFRAQMANMCCKKHCITLLVERLKCPDCKNKACRCNCLTYQNQQDRLARRKAAAERQQFVEEQRRKRHVQRQIEQAKPRHTRYRAQILESLTELPGKAGLALDMTTNTMQSVKDLFDLLLAQVDKAAKFFTLPEGIDLIDLICLLYGVVTALGNSKVALTIALIPLARRLRVDYTKWFALYSRLTTPVATAAQSSAAPVASVLQLLGAILVSGITLLAGGGSASYAGMTKHLSDFGRAAIGWTKITDLFVWIRDLALDCYYQYTLGKSREQIEVEQKYPLLQNTLEKCAMLRSDEFKESFLERDAALCRRVIQLEDTLVDLKMTATRARDIVMEKIVTMETQKLSKTFVAARNSAASCYNTRAAPATLYIYGRAGVGKSNLLNYLKMSIYAKHYSDSPEWTMNNIAHTRICQNEYWDGILPDQPIVVYDDMLQTKDSQSLPNPEILEFIRIKNEAPYHLHMSQTSEKKNTFLTAKFVLATSNVRVPKPVSISDASAFIRRWDMAIDVRVNPAYGKNSACGQYTMIDTKLVEKAASTKGEAFNTDVYLIDVYDMGKDTVVKGLTNLTLPDFLTHFHTSTAKQNAASEKMVASMQKQCGLEPAEKISEYKEFDTRFSALHAQSMDGEKPDEDTSSEAFLKNIFTASVQAKEDSDEAEKVAEGESAFNYTETTPEADLCSSWLAPVQAKVASTWETFRAVEWKRVSDSAFVKALKEKRDQLTTPPTTLLGHLIQWFTGFVTAGFAAAILVNHLLKPVSAWFVKMVRGHTCPFVYANTWEEFKTISCDCKVCKDFGSSHILGTARYGMDALEFALMNTSLAHNVVDIRLTESRTQLLKLHREEALEEGVLSYVRKNVNFNCKLSNLVGESRRETTHAAPRKYMTESRETTTRATPRRPYTAELVECPIYDRTRDQTKLRAQSSDVVMLEQHESVTYRNMVTLSSNSSGRHGRVNGVFVKGRVLLTVNHFIESVRRGSGDFVITNPNGQDGSRVRLSDCTVKQCVDLDNRGVDMAMITIPTSPSRKDIVAKFATAREINHINEGSIVVSGLRRVNEIPSLFNHHAHKFAKHTQTIYSGPFGDCRIHKALEYDLDTAPGDCGALVYAKNPMIAGKILGMHVAGLKGAGMAVILSREFISRNIALLEQTGVSRRMFVDGRAPFEAEMRLKEVQLQQSIPENTLTKLGNCLSLGMLEAPFASTKTQLKPSLVSGTLQEPDTKPAYLRPVRTDAGLVDPLLKGISKILNTTEKVNSELLDMAVADIANIHTHDDDNHSVLTFEEAVSGTDQEYVTALNRKSSPGFPYCLNNPGTGKRHWFGDDDFTYSDEIRRDVDDLIQHARNNQRGDVVWTATLKDERRPIAKVNAGKTRVFAAGPMHYTIAFRMYFMNFIESVMRNRITNEIGVGTNVYNLDWHRTALALQRKGKRVIAGDFSNYDGSLLQDVMWAILDMINEWYDDGEENAQIRSVLFEEICNARILVNGEVVQCDHSQPSGNPGTVIFNSLFNQIVMRLAYLDCRVHEGLPLVCNFTEHVSMQTFGDDNVLNISDEVVDWYNQKTITRSLSTFGLTYTDEAKTGELVESRTLDEVAYLKRNFVQDSNGYFTGPLDLNVCKEMTNWIRKSAGLGKAATLENCEASMREHTLHGRETYNHAKKVLSTALRGIGVNDRLMEYSEQRNLLAAGLF